jgi:hypothetical protein
MAERRSWMWLVGMGAVMVVAIPAGAAARSDTEGLVRIVSPAGFASLVAFTDGMDQFGLEQLAAWPAHRVALPAVVLRH